MLKRKVIATITKCCLITVQDNTMLKQEEAYNGEDSGLITVQDNTMLKPIEKLLDL